MPQHFAVAFVRAVPDLDSWFLVRLRLIETAARSDSDPWADDPVEEDSWWYSSETSVPRLTPAEARKQAEQYVQRMERGLQHQVDPAELESTFLLPATTVLVRAGLDEEATALEQRFRTRLSRPPAITPAPAASQPPSSEAALELAREIARRGKQLDDSLRFKEAEAEYRAALALLEAHAPDSPELTTILNNLAQLLHATHRLAEAEPLMRRALAIDEASYGAEHPDVAIRLNNLAQLLQATHRLTEAEPLMRRRVEILLGFFVSTGHHHPNEALSISNYRILLEAMNYTPEQIYARLKEIAA